MRTRPGRLLLSETTIMGYFGLDPSSYAAEVSSLGGPSKKTILRIMRGETTDVRPSTRERLTRGIESFERKKLPGILGSTAPKEASERPDAEVEKVGIRLFELIESAKEGYVVELIEDHCCSSISLGMVKNPEARMVLYNLCVFHGFEYFWHYPNDVDFLVNFSPRELEGKAGLPLRLWANQHIVASKKLVPLSRAKNLSQLATELKITKQTLHRYIEAKESGVLPKFRTMVRWSELLEDSSGTRPLAKLSTVSLFMARFLHNFYVDILKSTSLSEKEVLELFGLSKELRALWPSVLLR